MWAPQINAFDNSVITYDILGHGKTSLKKENITFDDFSDQLKNLVDELDIKKFHLVGFSIGSLIARNFACRFNERLIEVERLCGERQIEIESLSNELRDNLWIEAKNNIEG